MYMRRITLIRHAKSSWEFDVIDHERPLKKRGVNDSNLVSDCLKNKNIKFDKILSSDAIRTKSTVDIFLKNLNINVDKVEFKHSLYDFAGRDLLEEIKNCENNVNHLLVFGHNHAITAFVNTYGNVFIDNVPTSGVVSIEFYIKSWRDLSKGKTLFSLFPRDLKK